mmetsp:Transcript_18182/g.20719  ORF Transcript_18182/g.20719 Transcript_18182/m.20719 type:complete len:87 (+) Transcript_18182:329-589(+)
MSIADDDGSVLGGCGGSGGITPGGKAGGSGGPPIGKGGKPTPGKGGGGGGGGGGGRTDTFFTMLSLFPCLAAGGGYCGRIKACFCS